MNPTLIAAEIARRIPEMAKDSAINNENVIRAMIEEMAANRTHTILIKPNANTVRKERTDAFWDGLASGLMIGAITGLIIAAITTH